jgi:hypothetical protein
MNILHAMRRQENRKRKEQAKALAEYKKPVERPPAEPPKHKKRVDVSGGPGIRLSRSWTIR